MSSVVGDRLIGELLRNPNAARIRFVERGLSAAGHPAIRQPYLPIFEYMDVERGSRVSTLAGHANITAQAMGELVNHLVAQGYVEKVPDFSDGRARLVRLTDRGREVYALAKRLVQALETSWAGYLGEEKLQQLKCLLAELGDAISAEPVTQPKR